MLFPDPKWVCQELLGATDWIREQIGRGKRLVDLEREADNKFYSPHQIRDSVTFLQLITRYEVSPKLIL